MSDDYSQDSAPRERSTYSAFGDEYRGFDAREEESGGGKGLLVVGLAAGVVLVFGTVVWNAYRAGVKADKSDTPIIRADAGDYKSRPDDRGGLETPNQDKRLFDTMDNNDRTETEVPATMTTEATPVYDGVPTDIRPTRPEAAKPSPEPVTTPTSRPEPTLLPAVQPTYPSVTFDQSGNYLVQIMALRDIASAEKAWSQLVEANPDLFAGAVLDVQRADLGAKGIFFRVRASAFTTREGASAFCDKLKARGQACIVAVRS